MASSIKLGELDYRIALNMSGVWDGDNCEILLGEVYILVLGVELGHFIPEILWLTLL